VQTGAMGSIPIMENGYKYSSLPVTACYKISLSTQFERNSKLIA
jgi:hypothetical protein